MRKNYIRVRFIEMLVCILSHEISRQIHLTSSLQWTVHVIEFTSPLPRQNFFISTYTEQKLDILESRKKRSNIMDRRSIPGSNRGCRKDLKSFNQNPE